MSSEESTVLELEHAIGFSGRIGNSLFLHPFLKNKALHVNGASLMQSDLNDFHDQRFFFGHDSPITCIAYSRSGNLVATGQAGFRPDVLVWDVHRNEQVHRFQEHDVRIVALAFSSDERVLASLGGEADQKLIFWDLYTGMIICIASAAPQPCELLAFGGMVKDIKNRETESYLMVSAGSRALEIWSLNPFTGEITHNRMNPTGVVRDYTVLCFSQSNEFLYAGSRTGDVIVVNVKYCSLYTTIACDRLRSGVASLCALSTGLLIGGATGELLFYRLIPETRAQKAEFLESSQATPMLGAVTGISADESQQIIAGTSEGMLYRIQIPRTDSEKMGAQYISESHTCLVKGLSYDPHCSDHFVTTSYDSTVRLWNLNDYRAETKIMNTENGHPECVAYTLDCIYTGWEKGFITSHASETGEHLWTLKNCHREGVTSLKISRNERFLVSGGNGGELRVWELRSREMMCHLKEHAMPVTQVELFADDFHCVSSSRDRSILCWDLKAERRIGTLTQRMGSINSLSLASDQTTILSVGSDKTVNFWDLRVPTPVQIVEHTHEAYAIHCSQQKPVFVTGGAGCVVQLWDMRKLTPLSAGQGHSGAIYNISFSPDNKQVASVGEDGIFLWNLL